MSFDRPELSRRADYQSTGADDYFIVTTLRQHIYRLLNTYLPPRRPAGHVLDIGCGSQPFRRQCEAAGYTYTGFDITQNSTGTVDYLGAIDDSLPDGLITSGPFDLIICTEVLEHVADWQTTFHNAALLLAPGGHLLVTCPFFYQLHEEPFDYWRPTIHALTFYGQRAGLRTVEISRAGDSWDILGTLLGSSRIAAAHSGAASYLAYVCVGLLKRCLYALLRRSIPQRLVHTESKLYLSNIAVFSH